MLHKEEDFEEWLGRICTSRKRENISKITKRVGLETNIVGENNQFDDTIPGYVACLWQKKKNGH